LTVAKVDDRVSTVLRNGEIVEIEIQRREVDCIVPFVELLDDVRRAGICFEQEQIAAAAALHGIVAETTVQGIVAAAAFELVVAEAAKQHIAAAAADQRVVAIAAVEII